MLVEKNVVPLQRKTQAGCSSARLEYASGGRVVAGSNPVTPTGKSLENQTIFEAFAFLYILLNAFCGCLLAILFLSLYIRNNSKLLLWLWWFFVFVKGVIEFIYKSHPLRTQGKHLRVQNS